METEPGNSRYGPCVQKTLDEIFEGEDGRLTLARMIVLMRKAALADGGDRMSVFNGINHMAASLGMYDLYRKCSTVMDDVHVVIKPKAKESE